MLVYNEIPTGNSDPNKSVLQKQLEHELICLTNSHRPDRYKNRIKEIKQELKRIKK